MRCNASISVATMLLAGGVVAGTAVAASPVRIAVFPFELMDLSAAAPYVAPDDIDREQLRLSTAEARRLIAESGRYQLVDVNPGNEQIAKAGQLRDCEGCEAGIGRASCRERV